MRPRPWLEDLVRDVGYGLRTLRRRPGLTATAVLSLALGIGANAGVFSLVDQILLRLLPVREPERVVLLEWRGPSLPINQIGDGNLLSYPLCSDLHAQNTVLEGAFCRHPGEVYLSAGGENELVRAEIVSGSYFAVLGVQAELGRLIAPSDDLRLEQHPVIVLSHDYWQNSLGSPADIVGRRVLVNKHPMTVIGVAAPGFRGVDLVQPATLWIPAMMAPQTLGLSRVLDRRVIWMHAFGRLKPGVSADQATAGLQPWFVSMLEAEARAENFPKVTDGERRRFLASTIQVLPGAQGWSSLRGRLEQPLLGLLIGTALLLLLACLNVASLLLARGAERTQELTTRMALGATQGRITRQLIVEALIIALAGGAIALVVAPGVSRLLLRFLPEGARLSPDVDYRIFAFALVASLVAGVLCAVAPAFQARRYPLASSVTGRSTAAGATVRFRKGIVAAQLALTLLLLAGAGLFVQTVTRLYARDRGFESSRLLMFRADPAGAGSASTEAPVTMRNLRQRLQDIPDVRRVAVANNSLLGGLGPGRVLTIESDRRIVLETPVPMMRIGAGFFSTIGVPMIAGREFDEPDTLDIENTGFRSVIVNQSFARRYFGDRSPVGRRLGFGNRPDTPVDIEIVGVVSDFRRRFVRDDTQPEHIFVPFAQSGPLAGDGVFYVRVRGTPESAFGPIRAAVADIDPRLPLNNLTTIDDQVGRSLMFERMLATLSSAFGTVALLLSVVGLFGVMSFVVTQRTPEIGMRLALGATRSAAMGLVIRDALATILVGTGAGIVMAVAAATLAAPWLADVLYGVSPADIATFAATAILLTGVALAACVIPAGRAALLSPMVAIRDQPESLWRAARLKVRQKLHELGADGRPASVTLIGELTGLVQEAATFSEALRVALPVLRHRVGAQSMVLLEKTGDEYRGEDGSIPASGVLINRLRHFPHPLPLTPGDLQAWLRWAREFRPEHAAEIERLNALGVRMAVALRTRREIVGVLLLGAPEGRDEFSVADKQLLASAAEVFALMIENARLNERALEQEKVRRDIALAAEVQRRLLPARPPACAAASLAAFTLPARSVGGDLYDFVELPGGRLGIVVADIAGKGIAAALLTSVVQTSLRVFSAERDFAASQLAARMNDFLYQSTASSSYATFFYAQLDADGRRLRYVNAGHNPPYLVRRTAAGAEVTALTVGGMVIGMFPGAAYEDGELALCPGDLLVVFTDGVTEARNADDEEFGEDRLLELLKQAVGAQADAVSSMLAGEMQRWVAGAEQHDDLTFVVATMN